MAEPIVAIDAAEVVCPTEPGAITSPSLLEPDQTTDWSHEPICLLRFEFADGLTGLGETWRGFRLADLADEIAELIGHTPSALGMAGQPESWRPVAPRGLTLRVPNPPWSSASRLDQALEVALLDWAGKRTGLRIVDLLGGACRTRVPVDYWCGYQTPDDLADKARHAVALGFTGIKTKASAQMPMIEQLEAVIDAVGREFSITIDPMSQWDSTELGMRWLKAIDRLGANVRVEDPFSQSRIDDWVRARQTVATPLIWHARHIDSLRAAIKWPCADAFNISGSIAKFMTLAHVMEVLDHRCWHGSGMELGVNQAAALHGSAAATCCVMPSDLASALIRPHLTDWDWPYDNGALPLPPGPGLGMALDEDAVEKHATDRRRFT